MSAATKKGWHWFSFRTHRGSIEELRAASSSLGSVPWRLPLCCWSFWTSLDPKDSKGGKRMQSWRVYPQWAPIVWWYTNHYQPLFRSCSEFIITWNVVATRWPPFFLFGASGLWQPRLHQHLFQMLFEPQLGLSYVSDFIGNASTIYAHFASF